MEEREQSSVDENHRSSKETRNTTALSHAESANHSETLPGQPVYGSGTYIVQVPKDQIYRIPPPENAILAEGRRNPQQHNGCCSCSLYLFIGVIVTVLLVIVGSIIGIFFNHDKPGFSIEHFLVKNLSPKQRLEYDIRLKVENPNKFHVISYYQDSDVTLSFKKKEIADGYFRKFDQGPKASRVLNIVLNGSIHRLPKEVSASMNSTQRKMRMPLSLSMNVPVKLEIWGFDVKSKKIEVSCSLMIDRFNKDAHLLTQECSTNG